MDVEKVKGVRSLSNLSALTNHRLQQVSMGNVPSNKRPRREMDKYFKPTGLYQTCPWEQKAVKKMVASHKIAPRFKGKEDEDPAFNQECPICFMYYPDDLNRTTCCKQLICTECYLQMKPPKKAISCPFCMHDTFSVTYAAADDLSIVLEAR